MIKIVLDIAEVVMGLPNGSTYEGFKKITGDKNYLLAIKDNELICTFYDLDAGKQLINKYLEEHNIKNEEVKLVHKRKLEAEELKEYYNKKIVIYDKKVCLFGDVYGKVESAIYPPVKGLNKY